MSYLVLVLLFNVEGSTTSSDPVHDNPFNWKASKVGLLHDFQLAALGLQAQPPTLTLPKAVVIHMKISNILRMDVYTEFFVSKFLSYIEFINENPILKTHEDVVE